MAAKLLKKLKPVSAFPLIFLKKNQNLFSILLAVVATLLCSRLFESKDEVSELETSNYHEKNLNVPKYWHVCEAEWNENGHLRTMDRVFERLGFDFVNASNGDDWDVMWGFEYPFDKESELFDPLYENKWKHHQRLNHFPGNGHLTSKKSMTTENRDLKFIMPTFNGKSVVEFEEYVEENPEKKFVEKNIFDRGVKVIDKSKIDFNDTEKIYQVFMDKPMLIDDRAFDMGVYALISSVNPLRVYRYDSEILMRFCPDPYYPFNASNVDQYVIYESHLQYDELPSFQKYDKVLGYSLKHIFENHLREKGLDPKKLWKQVDEIMATLTARMEPRFIYWVGVDLNDNKFSNNFSNCSILRHKD